MKQTASTACQSKRGRHVVRRSHAKSAPFILVENPKFCLAEPHGVRHQGLENRLQFARRVRDNPQHLGCRRLLLQRLAQLPARRIKLALKKSEGCFFRAAGLAHARRLRPTARPRRCRYPPLSAFGHDCDPHNSI